MYTIRLVDYGGDNDDLNDVNIVGPYDTRHDRDTDLRRLACLPGVYGLVKLFPATTPPEAADYACGPLTVRDVATVEELMCAVYGLDYDPATDQWAETAA